MNQLRAALLFPDYKIEHWSETMTQSEIPRLCSALVCPENCPAYSEPFPMSPYKLFRARVNQTKNGYISNLANQKPDPAPFWKLADESTRELEFLAVSMDALDVGLEIWSKDDHLLLYNRKINLLLDGLYDASSVGQTVESVLQRSLSQDLIKIGNESRQNWIQKRLSTRRKSSAPLLQELFADRWVHIYETETMDGLLVVAWVDVTDLVRRGRVLEVINARLTVQSSTDALTGLANRRKLDEALSSEYSMTASKASPLSLLMVDIDYFKRFNDHYGHLAGDACLRRVAEILGQCVRRTGELVARFGGEEFVMLLPGSTLAQACETAQKCLDLIHQARILHGESPIGQYLTISIGVASFQQGTNVEISHILNAADNAMYRGKSCGRDRFEIATSLDWYLDKDSVTTPELKELSTLKH